MTIIRKVLEDMRDRHAGASDDNRIGSVDRELWSHADALAALEVLNESKRGWFHDGATLGDQESAYREVFDPWHGDKPTSHDDKSESRNPAQKAYDRHIDPDVGVGRS